MKQLVEFKCLATTVLLLVFSSSCNETNQKENVATNHDYASETESADEWGIEKEDIIDFSEGNDFLVQFTSKTINEFTKQFKLSIYKIDCFKKKTLIWKSNTADGEKFESFDILKSQNNAVIAGTYNLGGAHALSSYFVVQLNSNGTVNPLKELEQFGSISIEYKLLKITEENQEIHFEAKGNSIVKKVLTKENMSSNATQKAYFKIDGQNIVGITKTISLNVGETIAFVPSDDNTRKQFNTGQIAIYSDAWNNDLSICEANRIQSGNSYTFDKTGQFHFLLCIGCFNADQTPTFTVNIR